MTARTFAVRQAVPDDARAICDLSRQAILVSAAEHYTPLQLRAWAARRTLAAHRQMIRSTTAFVAVEDGTILGFATVALTPRGALDRGEVDQLFVHPAHAGRGVAGALLARLEKAAREAGVERLLTHASWRAAPVFERSGYQPDEVETVVVNGQELTRIRMHKRLDGHHDEGVA